MIDQIFMGDRGSKTERREGIKSSQQGGTREREKSESQTWEDLEMNECVMEER